MADGELDYLRSRAAREVELMRLAVSEEARAVHAALAKAYALRASHRRAEPTRFAGWAGDAVSTPPR